MMTPFISGGKLILTGGNPLVIDISGGTPTPSNMTSLTSVQFSTGNPLSAFIIQRKAGTIYGDVPFIGTFTGTISSSIQGRVKDSSGNIVKDWTTLSNVTVVGNQFVGYLPGVRQGIDMVREFRDGSQPTNSATSSGDIKKFAIGVKIGWHGQSNMVNPLGYGFNDGTGAGDGEYDHSQTAAARSRYSIFSFNGFDGAAATGQLISGRLIAQKLEQFYGYPVPVCIVPYAVNGSGIEAWNSDGGFLDSLYTASGTTGGTVGYSSPKNIQPGGDVEIICWDQGEGNVQNARAAYLAQQKILYQYMLSKVAPYGRTAANFSFLFSALGIYGDGAGMNTAENIRGSQLDFENFAKANSWPNARFGCNRMDLDPETSGDGLHFNAYTFPFMKWAISRHIQSVYKALGLSAFDGTGPRIAGWTRSGLVVTLDITLNGGTALMVKNSGAAITGFYANTAADFSGTDIPVTAAIVNGGTKIAITYPNGTTNFGALKHMGGKVGTRQSYHPDCSNMIYNNASYPEGATGPDAIIGLPLFPTPDPIMVT